MKHVVALTALSMAATFCGAAAPTVTYVDHAKVVEIQAKEALMVATDAFKVSSFRRTAAGEVEVHEKETDIFYVIDGEATILTGGTMVGGRSSAPGQLRGTGIQGGQSHHLVKGDVIVIPAGIPHWFKDVPQSVSYFIVKSLQP